MIYIMYSLIYFQVCILFLTCTVDWENKGKHSIMVSPSQYFAAFNKARDYSWQVGQKQVLRQ